MNTQLQTQPKATSAPTFMPVRSGLLQRKCACGGTPGPTGECAACRKKREATLQRAAISPGPINNAPPIVHEVLRSSGQPLDQATRAFMEPRFGHDFSGVRVHSDGKAAESARRVNALAYTVGRDVVFGSEQYASGTKAGQRLLAHELTHVVQQSRGGGSNLATALQVSEPGNADEREAEAVARQVMDARANEQVETDIHPENTTIQRLGDLTKIPAGLEANCEIASDSPPLPTEDLLFGNAVAAISPLLQAQIDNFVRTWQAAGANAPVRVDGFASIVGTDELNWRLSCDRALAVAAAMGSPSPGIAGIPARFIQTVAQGETTEFGAEANNRRATISSPILARPAPTPPAPIPPTPVPTLPTLRFWVNAFIPDTLSGAFSAPAGPFAGRQVFPGPPAPFHFNSCFETDERGFTNALPVSSRLHVNAEFDTSSRRLTSRSGVAGGFTFEIDCTTGATKCTSPVRPRGSGVVLVSPILPGSSRFDILMEAFANDPCVAVSPDLTIRGDIAVDLVARTFDFTVLTTLFPAMEMYMSVAGGAPTTLFTMSPPASSVGLLFIPGVSPHTGSGRF